jgi:hypothetical protein
MSSGFVIEFYFADETGPEALVQPRRAELHIVVDHGATLGAVATLTDALLAWATAGKPDTIISIVDSASHVLPPVLPPTSRKPQRISGSSTSVPSGGERRPCRPARSPIFPVPAVTRSTTRPSTWSTRTASTSMCARDAAPRKLSPSASQGCKAMTADMLKILATLAKFGPFVVGRYRSDDLEEQVLQFRESMAVAVADGSQRPIFAVATAMENGLPVEEEAWLVATTGNGPNGRMAAQLIATLLNLAPDLVSLRETCDRHRELMQRLANPVWRQIVGALDPWRGSDEPNAQEQCRAWNDEQIALSRAFFDAAFRGAPVDDALMARALDFLEGKTKQPSQEAIDQTIAAGVSPTE